MLEQVFDSEHAVLSLVLSRPPVNALNKDLYEALKLGLQAAAQDSAVKSVMLTASGTKAFCAGADIKEYAHLSKHDAETKQIELLLDCLKDFVSFPKPVLAAVDGAAIGAGLMLVCACDEIVMTDNAWVSLPEIAMDLPTPIGAAIVSRRLRHAKVHDLLQRAERMLASQCQAEGLADAVVAQPSLVQASLTRLSVYKPIDSAVYGINKRWLNRSLVRDLEAAAAMVAS